jgi:hypothetical protein
MRKGILALAAAGALGVFLGSAVTASAQASATATIANFCVSAGGTQTITVEEPQGTFVDVLVGSGGGSANGAADANGKFVDSFTVSSSAAGTVGVRVFAFTSEGLAFGTSSFNVVSSQASPCPTTSSNARTFSVDVLDTTQVSNSFKKTCASGVSGSAVFSFTVPTEGGTAIGPSLTAACNGAAVDLPKLPVDFNVVLHESTPPTNGVAAADVTLRIASGADTITINNAAASVATPAPTAAPTARRLANTGGAAGNPMLPWPVILLGLLLAVTGAGLILRRAD